jgi:hypothetical protein
MQQGGLAGTGRARQNDTITFPDLAVHIAQHGQALVAA